MGNESGEWRGGCRGGICFPLLSSSSAVVATCSAMCRKARLAVTASELAASEREGEEGEHTFPARLFAAVKIGDRCFGSVSKRSERSVSLPPSFNAWDPKKGSDLDPDFWDLVLLYPGAYPRSLALGSCHFLHRAQTPFAVIMPRRETLTFEPDLKKIRSRRMLREG